MILKNTHPMPFLISNWKATSICAKFKLKYFKDELCWGKICSVVPLVKHTVGTDIFISLCFCKTVQDLTLHSWYLMSLPIFNTNQDIWLLIWAMSFHCFHLFSVSLEESQWQLRSLWVWQQPNTNCTMRINIKQHVQWYVKAFKMTAMNFE